MGILFASGTAPDNKIDEIPHKNTNTILLTRNRFTILFSPQPKNNFPENTLNTIKATRVKRKVLLLAA